jgi:hypothetical protein
LCTWTASGWYHPQIFVYCRKVSMGILKYTHFFETVPTYYFLGPETGPSSQDHPRYVGFLHSSPITLSPIMQVLVERDSLDNPTRRNDTSIACRGDGEGHSDCIPWLLDRAGHALVYSGMISWELAEIKNTCYHAVSTKDMRIWWITNATAS